MKWNETSYAFSALKLGKLSRAIDLDACTKDLDLVGVHCYPLSQVKP